MKMLLAALLSMAFFSLICWGIIWTAAWTYYRLLEWWISDE